MNDLFAAEVGEEGCCARGWRRLLVSGFETHWGSIWLWAYSTDPEDTKQINSAMIKTHECRRRNYLFACAGSLGAFSVVSISSELSESLSDPEELSESDEPSELSSAFVFETAFMVCFCLLSGSGEVDPLELLSLSDEDEAVMVARCHPMRSFILYACIGRSS